MNSWQRIKEIYHEERVGRLHKTLELVLLLLELSRWVQQINIVRKHLITENQTHM